MKPPSPAPVVESVPTMPVKSTEGLVQKQEGPTRETWPQLLREAACEVFFTMLGSEATPAPPGTEVAASEFTAMVGLAGQLRGLCVLRCSSKAANRMASKMLGIEMAKTTDHTFDAFGEICNMVAGNFKNKLTGISEHCMLSCPTVISGRDYECHPSGSAESMSLTLLFEGNPLGVVLQIHK